MLLSSFHQRRTSKAVGHEMGSLSPARTPINQKTMNSSISKFIQKRNSVFLNKTDIANTLDGVNQSQVSGVNESKDISGESSVRGSQSRLLVQKDKTSNQIWVQRIPRLNASSDLPPQNTGLKRKVRAKAKGKVKPQQTPDNNDPQQQTSNLGISSGTILLDDLAQSLNDMSQAHQKIEIPNNTQHGDDYQTKVLESIQEDIMREDDHNSPTLNSKKQNKQSNPIITTTKSDTIKNEILPTTNIINIQNTNIIINNSIAQSQQTLTPTPNESNSTLSQPQTVKVVTRGRFGNSQTRSTNNQDNPQNQPNPKPSPEVKSRIETKQQQKVDVNNNAYINIQNYKLQTKNIQEENDQKYKDAILNSTQNIKIIKPTIEQPQSKIETPQKQQTPNGIQQQQQQSQIQQFTPQQHEPMTSIPSQNQQVQSTPPTNAQKKRQNPSDMYPKDSLEQPMKNTNNHQYKSVSSNNVVAHQKDQNSFIHSVVNTEQERVNQILMKQQKSQQSQYDKDQEEPLMENQTSSDFQSVDLMSISNSVKHISPPTIQNIKQSLVSHQKLELNQSINQSMLETPNFTFEESISSKNTNLQLRMAQEVTKKFQVNLNKRISINRPSNISRQLIKKVESVQSIEQLDQNSEISPPNKFLITDDDLRGSVISLDNYNNMSVRFGDDSELRMSRAESRAIYQHQIIRPNNNDQSSSPQCQEGFESMIMNESYDESIRNRLLKQMTLNQMALGQRDTRNNPSNNLRSFADSTQQQQPFTSFGTTQDNQSKQGQDNMVPSLLRYNKSNISLKEPVTVEEAIMNPINALKESTKKIKILRNNKEQHQQQHLTLPLQNDSSQSAQQNLINSLSPNQNFHQHQNSFIEYQTINTADSPQTDNLRNKRQRKSLGSNEEFTFKIKSSPLQELKLDPISEDKKELEPSPKNYKVQNMIDDPAFSPAQLLSIEGLQMSQDSNSMSLQSSPFIDMTKNKFYNKVHKQKEFVMLIDDEYSALDSQDFDPKLLTHRPSAPDKSQLSMYRTQVPLQNSDQKLKTKNTRVTFVEKNQHFFDSISSSANSMNLGGGQKQSSRSRQRKADEVFQRLYNSKGNSKSPLRSSMKKREEDDSMKSTMKAIGAYSSMTYSSKPIDGRKEEEQNSNFYSQYNKYRDEFASHLQQLKGESSPINSTGSRVIMPIIKTREKKIVKLILDDDQDDVSDNVSQNTQGRFFIPPSQINYNTPSDLSFYESFQDSVRRQNKRLEQQSSTFDNQSAQSSQISLSASVNTTTKKQMPPKSSTNQFKVQKQNSLNLNKTSAGTAKKSQLIQSQTSFNDKKYSTQQIHSTRQSRDHTPSSNTVITPHGVQRVYKDRAPKQKIIPKSRPSQPRQIVEPEIFYEPFQDKKLMPLLVSNNQNNQSQLQKEQRVTTQKPKPVKNQFSHTSSLF